MTIGKVVLRQEGTFMSEILELKRGQDESCLIPIIKIDYILICVKSYNQSKNQL